jgi:hypothetical protein
LKGGKFFSTTLSVHRSSIIVATFFAAIAAFLNLPGQIVVEPSSGMYPGGGSWLGCQQVRLQGWPFSFLRHELEYLQPGRKPFDSTLVWTFPHVSPNFSKAKVALNVACCIALFAVVLLIAEYRRRQRRSFWQVRISEMLAVTLCIAAICAALAAQKRKYDSNESQLSGLRPFVLGGGPPRNLARWQHGGPHWLRAIVGDRFPDWLDQVVHVEAEGGDVHIVAGMSGILQFTPHGIWQPKQLEYITQIDGLRSIDFDHAYSFDFATKGRWESVEGEREFMRLADTKSLTHLSLHNLYIGPSAYSVLLQMPQLEELVLSHASDSNITDDTLKYLAKLNRLKLLSVKSSRVTSKGVENLVHLQQLKYLQLDFTGIDDASIESIAKLSQLEVLTLDGTAVSADAILRLAALPHLRFVGLSHELRQVKIQFERKMPDVEFY